MDFLQIALEHHRAGRLQQAEAGYRAMIEADPQNADANHWLGVLLFQAGQAESALPLLERAATIRPLDPAFQHNLGQAWLSSGRIEQAIEALQRAADLAPDRADTLAALGHAHLSQRSASHMTQAVAALQKARGAGLDSADLHFHLGIALLGANRPDEAIASFRAALERNSELAAAYHHLALAHRIKNEPREVRKCLNKALELDPGMARAWHDLATLDADAGNAAVAAGLYRKAVAAKPDLVPAWQGLGRVLQQLGNAQDAARAFEQAARAARGELSPSAPAAETPESQSQSPVADLERKLSSSVTQALHFALATRRSVFTPAQIPKSTLTDLFNNYSDYFDEQLRNALQYRVPEMVAQAAGRLQGIELPLGASEISGSAQDALNQAALDILDLGCGTGLCGLLLKPIARRLCGVDLSPGMIQKARERGIYDQLDVGDLVELLKPITRSFDLLVSADVFIYVGDLAGVFEAAARALRPGGHFIFSVEAGGGERYNLNMITRRYTHSAPYLRRLATMCGFQVVSFESIPVRTEAGKCVPGYLPVLRSSGV